MRSAVAAGLAGLTSPAAIGMRDQLPDGGVAKQCPSCQTTANFTPVTDAEMADVLWDDNEPYPQNPVECSECAAIFDADELEQVTVTVTLTRRQLTTLLAIVNDDLEDLTVQDDEAHFTGLVRLGRALAEADPHESGLIPGYAHP